MVRPLNRLLGLLLGLALAGSGGFTVVEVILAAFKHPFVVVPADRWLHTLRTTGWSSEMATIGSAVAAALGLVLLVTEIRPRRPRRVRLAGQVATPGVSYRSPATRTKAETDARSGESLRDDRPSDDGPSIEHMDWWLLRQSVENHLKRIVVASTPTSRARVRLMARRRHWRARIRVNAPAAARREVGQAARASLERLGAPTRRVRVKVRKLRFHKQVRVG